MSEHFKQHLKGRGIHNPPHPPPSISNPVSTFVSDVSGKSGLKIERGGRGKAIFSELKIVDIPETLDPTPNHVPGGQKKMRRLLKVKACNLLCYKSTLFRISQNQTPLWVNNCWWVHVHSARPKCEMAMSSQYLWDRAYTLTAFQWIPTQRLQWPSDLLRDVPVQNGHLGMHDSQQTDSPVLSNHSSNTRIPYRSLHSSVLW